MTNVPHALTGAQTPAIILQNHVFDGTEVRDFLDDLAVHAAQELSATAMVHCGVTLLRENLAGTAGSSSEWARKLDETQYSFADGPCLEAARTREVTHVPAVNAEKRWRDYLAEITSLRVSAILAVPFELTDGASGALNIYAESPRAFDDDAVATAERYANQANSALRLAVRVAALNEAGSALRAAMEARTTIGVALGVLMARNKCSQQEALDLLTRESEEHNLKPHHVASRIIQTASPGKLQTHFDE